MSSGYKAISWNKYKIRYDILLWSACILYIGGFIIFNLFFYKTYNTSTAIIRAFGTLAILLLHVVLFIGPAARLNSQWLPILYNRRHLGVTTFIIAAIHGIFSIIWYHGHGNINPVLSVFESNLHYGSLIFFPFQTLGILALLILAAMAFTSHDFWLSFLGPKFWKAMHMMVYVAYFLVMMHVVLGVIQLEKSPFLVLLLWIGMFVIIFTHLFAAFKEIKRDHTKNKKEDNGWVYVCKLQEIAESRAKISIVNGERVAIFKYDGKLSAVHNVCKHQLGPLGEGRVLDGCIVCPWHGYQYRPEDGCAPPPFTEKLQTYRLRISSDDIFINVHPLAEGTYVEPLLIPACPTTVITKKHFFIGWSPGNDHSLYRFALRAGLLLAAGILITGFFVSEMQHNITGYSIDYDHVKELEGWLLAKPVPILRIIDAKDSNGNPKYKNILLVDGFKHGASAAVQKFLKGDSVRYVKLKGYISTKVISCGKTGEPACDMEYVQCIAGTKQFPLMELENGAWSFENKKEPIAYTPEKLVNDGLTEITGEILDAKCYLGAMNPGYGKVHLSCAVRCISGGIMPMMIYKADGMEKFAILLGEHGEPVNKDILPYVGIKSIIKGNRMIFGNWQILILKGIVPSHHL